MRDQTCDSCSRGTHLCQGYSVVLFCVVQIKTSMDWRAVESILGEVRLFWLWSVVYGEKGMDIFRNKKGISMTSVYNIGWSAQWKQISYLFEGSREQSRDGQDKRVIIKIYYVTDTLSSARMTETSITQPVPSWRGHSNDLTCYIFQQMEVALGMTELPRRFGEFGEEFLHPPGFEVRVIITKCRLSASVTLIIHGVEIWFEESRFEERRNSPFGQKQFYRVLEPKFSFYIIIFPVFCPFLVLATK